MSPKKKNKRPQKRNINRERIDRDIEEADKIIAHLDELEKKKSEEMSSKAKKLIADDKEAIKKMQEEAAKVLAEELDDDLDYLDDEATPDFMSEKEEKQPELEEDLRQPEQEEHSKEESDIEKESQREKRSGKKNRKKKKKEKPEAETQEIEESKLNQDEQEDELPINRSEAESEDAHQKEAGEDEEREANSESEAVHEEQTEDDEELEVVLEEESEPEAESREKTKKTAEHSTGLRKKNPNMLGAQTKSLNSQLKYYIAGSVAIVLLVIMFIALILDRGVKKPDEKKPDETFIQDNNVDTAQMTEVVNKFYEKLDAGDMDGAKKYLYNLESMNDVEIQEMLNNIKNQVSLNKKLTGTSRIDFSGCYVQDGMSKDEYIVYMRFDMHITGVDTPAPGIYSFYIKDDTKSSETEEKESTADTKTTEETKDEETSAEETKVEETTAGETNLQETTVSNVKHNYKIVLISEASDSEIKQYMDAMRKSSTVQELFNQVENEYEVACSTDEDLKKIVEALNNNKSE